MKYIAKGAPVNGKRLTFEAKIALEEGKWTARLYCDDVLMENTRPVQFDYKIDVEKWAADVMADMQHALGARASS